MFSLLKQKKVVFIIFILGVFLIVLIATLMQTTKKTQQPSVSFPIPTTALFPTPANKNTISLLPSTSTILTPGKTQQFTANLQAISFPLSQVAVKLTKLDIQKDETPLVVPITTTLNEAKKEMSIQTQTPIDPHSEYTLQFTNTSENKVITTISYLSADTIPPAIVENNQELASYLPYDTDWYRLSYLPSQNLYVFNFKYNENSSLSLDAQYERAKQDAILFIRSKGIDESTIIIDWRHS